MPARRMPTGPAAALVALALAAAAPPLDAAPGDVDTDGAPHVNNPAAPSAGAETVSPDELWRAGGINDEDVIFGIVETITADDAGNLYVLDSQLNEVMVFSPDGEYLRSIGREGEGPGEFRRPGGMFITPEGNVAVLQTMPGRIILMTPDGEPVGNHPVPEAPGGGMMALFKGGRGGDAVVLDTRSFKRTDTGMEITRELVRIDGEGHVTNKLLSNTQKREFANMGFNEKDMRAVEWTCGPDGRVYVSDDFDAYRIAVFGVDGKAEHVIERDYQHRKRSKEEIEENKPRVMFRGRGGGAHRPETEGSPTDRDVLSLLPRADGTLWVVSSHGGLDAPDGVIATFDVYDPDGHFTRQVSVRGEGDFGDDGVHFVGDRLYVVRGLRSAQRAQMGGGDEELSDEDIENAEPMSLICYDLGPVVQGMR